MMRMSAAWWINLFITLLMRYIRRRMYIYIASIQHCTALVICIASILYTICCSIVECRIISISLIVQVLHTYVHIIIFLLSSVGPCVRGKKIKNQILKC